MTATMPSSRLTVSLAGIDIQNPIFLASGTAGYGQELVDIAKLESLGGLVTKAVSLEPRPGAPAPRVTEFAGGMLNAVGLANPGVEAVRALQLPWLAQHVTRARVFVNVVGSEAEDFARVIERLDDVPGKAGYELNVSCPNVKAGGLEFGADVVSLRHVVRKARESTRLPLFVKLSPALPDIALASKVAVEAGADGLTVANTLPGMLVDVEKRRPILGFGSGGVSGAGLLPVSVLATWRVHRATGAPIIGTGGISTAVDALQYILAGATAVAIGTAALRNPRLPERVVTDLASWCEVRGVRSIASLVGSLEWET
jgi:dihydroorotate dehydrogenase (NAD+) catalytic subunit